MAVASTSPSRGSTKIQLSTLHPRDVGLAMFTSYWTAIMNDSSHTQGRHGTVDWDDPELASLLMRSEGWQLDNRGGFASQAIQVFAGWNTAAGRPAMLVWEREQAAVIAAAFSLEQGDRVRLERHIDGHLRALFGVVIEGRKGLRDDDALRGIRLYCLRVTAQKS